MLQLRAPSLPEFMRALLTTEQHFESGRRYYFRGQADASWGLIPSIRRRDAWANLGGAEQHGLQCSGNLVVSDEETVLHAERALLSTVKNVLLQRGLSPSLQYEHELVALTQHIGLPTRALDWSRSPWTAAYFAASRALASALTGGEMAVFAMSDLYLTSSERMSGVAELAPSTFGNPTIIAQQGILVSVPHHLRDLTQGAPVREIALGEGARNAVLDDQLVKLTLAHDQAAALVRSLRDQDIHAASVSPSTSGIADLVRELYLTPT